VTSQQKLHNIIVSDISIKKLDALGYISVAESLGISSNAFTQCAPEATEFYEVTQNRGNYVVHQVWYQSVTLNDLERILHRFRDIAFAMSKIAIFGYPSCV